SSALTFGDEDGVPAEAVRATRLERQAALGDTLHDLYPALGAKAERAHGPHAAITQAVGGAANGRKAAELFPILDERPRKAAQTKQLDPRVLDDHGAAELSKSGLGFGQRDRAHTLGLQL